jgi:hypothetical protein
MDLKLGWEAVAELLKHGDDSVHAETFYALRFLSEKLDSYFVYRFNWHPTTRLEDLSWCPCCTGWRPEKSHMISVLDEKAWAVLSETELFAMSPEIKTAILILRTGEVRAVSRNGA